MNKNEKTTRICEHGKQHPPAKPACFVCGATASVARCFTDGPGSNKILCNRHGEQVIELTLGSAPGTFAAVMRILLAGHAAAKPERHPDVIDHVTDGVLADLEGGA